MKYKILLLSITIFNLFYILPQNTFAQSICRGHGNNDLYYSGQTSYYDYSLFRSVDNGSTSIMVNNANLLTDTVLTNCYYYTPIADRQEGVLYSLDRWRTIPPWLFTSIDNGINFIPNYNSPVAPVLMTGGEEPGEVYIQTRGNDPSLYYSSDSGQSFTLSHQADFYRLEVGTEPHEIWAFSGNATTYWLLYSNTNGVSFDTIPVDHSIMGEGGASFYQWSRGAQAGELFIATTMYSGEPGFDSIRLYRTVNYAQSFDLVYSEKKSIENTFSFTAGRAPCSLYIIRTEFAMDTITYWIEYSIDCGTTFTKTGIADAQQKDVQILQAYPNPFDSFTKLVCIIKESELIELEIFNSTGECVRTIRDQVLQPGYFSYMFNTVGLPTGLYLGVLKSNGLVIARNKLIKR